MILCCRICLSEFPIADERSKQLTALYTYYDPHHGMCNISFSDVVSSCLPDLNLHILIDGTLKICGSCCTKISELYDLKQKSLQTEKILLQYVKFHNGSNHDVKDPVKLRNVASMYNSVYKKIYPKIVLSDLLKQMISASTKPDLSPEKVKNVNPCTTFTCGSNETKTVDCKASSPTNTDSVILIVEENSNNLIDNSKQDSNYDCSNIRMGSILLEEESKESSAEAWFKISQNNLLAEELDPNCENNKSVCTLHLNEKPSISQDGQGSAVKEVVIQNDNNVSHKDIPLKKESNVHVATVSNTSLNNNGLAKSHKKSPVTNSLPRRCGLRSDRFLLRIPDIPQFVKDFDVDKQYKDLSRVPDSSFESKLEVISLSTNEVTNNLNESLRKRQASGSSSEGRSGDGSSNIENKIKLNETSSKWIDGSNSENRSGEGSLVAVNKHSINATSSELKVSYSSFESKSSDETANGLKIMAKKEAFNKRLHDIQNTFIPFPNMVAIAEQQKAKEQRMIHEAVRRRSKMVHKCKMCEISFHNASKLQKHLCSKAGLQCQFCWISFENVTEWNQHTCKKLTETCENTNSSSSQSSNNVVDSQEDSDILKTKCSDLSDFENPSDPAWETESMDTSNYIACEICDMVFLTKADLSDHVASHVSVKECNKYNNADMPALLDVQRIAQTEDATGAVLNAQFMTSEVANAEKFNCNDCPLTFDSKSQLLSHQQQHMNQICKKWLHCDKCGKKFLFAFLLRQHKNEHLPRQCPICGKPFSLSYNLHAHLLSHTRDVSKDAELNPDTIPIYANTEEMLTDTMAIDTNAAFLNSNAMALHADIEEMNSEAIVIHSNTDTMEIHAHKEEMNINTSNTDQEQIITPPISPGSILSISPIIHTLNRAPIIVAQLSPNSLSLPKLEQPINPGSDQPMLRCDKCGEFFKLQEELESHLNIHFINTKFQCNVCYKVFPSRPAYRVHQNTCVSKSSQTEHKRIGNTVFTRRGELSRLYDCKMCKKKFISRKFLADHFRGHMRASYMPQCKECFIVFANENALKKHVATCDAKAHE